MARSSKDTHTESMTQSETFGRPRSLAEYVAIVRRRKWALIIPLIVIPIVAYAYSARQTKAYSASSEVLVSRGDLSSTVTNVTNPNLFTDPDRYAATQAALAGVPAVAERAVDLSGVRDVTPAQLLANSSVVPRSNADLLRFTVKNRDADAAGKLATGYARAFASYSYELETGQLAKARSDLDSSLTKLRKQGAGNTDLYRQLAEKAQELKTLELLQTKPPVVTAAGPGGQVAPTPKRSAMLGAAFGFIIGLCAVFLWEALDKRVRDENEIAEILGIPLLARLPSPAESAGGRLRLAMLDDPGDVDAEAVRRLRSNIEFANLDSRAKVIMITSAVGSEGKSMAIANLAIALARSGRRVTLVDLDLRKPTIGRLFGLGNTPGVTDTAIERIGLEQALVPVHLRTDSAKTVQRRWDSPGVGESEFFSDTPGKLFVLPAGSLPASPGELVGTDAVAGILGRLREQMDFVLVDAPPLLVVSDAATLSAQVDAILVVTRLGIVNRTMLHELTRELEATRARKIGFVVTGVDGGELYGYAPRVEGEPAAAARQTPTVAPSPAVENARSGVAAPQRRSRMG
jgi:Mrp family chromosome partitioning ATPase/capsular polysaccharide biosynthesis protein